MFYLMSNGFFFGIVLLFFLDDDSDVDIVTDFLSSNADNKDVAVAGILNLNSKQPKSMLNNRQEQLDQQQHQNQQNHQNFFNIISGTGATTTTSTLPPLGTTFTPTTIITTTVPQITTTTTANNNNMVPIISVTPHSPGAKYNSILGESHILVRVHSYIYTKQTNICKLIENGDLPLHFGDGDDNN